jgi:hypothetical protein
MYCSALVAIPSIMKNFFERSEPQNGDCRFARSFAGSAFFSLLVSFANGHLLSW